MPKEPTEIPYVIFIQQTSFYLRYQRSYSYISDY